MTWSRIKLGFLAAPVVLACTMAGAQPADCPPCQAERSMRGLPEGCEVVLVVNRAAQQVASRPGWALAGAMIESRAMPETIRAWGELAAALDWTREQAFNELLGRKVTLLMRGLDNPSPRGPDWAVLAEVTPAAEMRLRERLKAAPRGTLAGMAVLAVEDGKYELMVGRGNPAGVPDATAIVLLGPRGENPLFTELAPLLLTRTGPASPPSNWRVGQKNRDCDIVLMLRQRAGGPDGAWRRLDMSAAFDAKGCAAEIVSSPGMLWDRPAGMGQVRPWSDGAFRAMEGEALVGVMGLVGATPLDGLGLLRGVFGVPLLSASWLTGHADGRLSAVFLRPALPRDEKRENRVEEPPARLIVADSRLPEVRHDAEEERVALPGQWCITMAVEAAEAGHAAAESERLAAGLLYTLENDSAPPEATPLVDLSGEGARGTGGFRRLPLDAGIPIHADLLPRLTRLAGESPALSWGSRLAAAPVMAKGGHGLEQRRGWCVFSLGPESAPMAARDAGVLAGTPGGTSRPRLSIGLVRPSALVSILGREDALVPGWARRLESVRWEAWLRDDGMIEATIGVRMVP